MKSRMPPKLQKFNMTQPPSRLTQETTDLKVIGETILAPGQSHLPSRKSPQAKSIISSPTIISSFSPDYEAPSLECAGQGLTWVRTSYKRLQLIDLHGSVKDTIDTTHWFNDIAVTPQGDILLADCNDNCIRSVSQAKAVTILFNTEYSPFGICCLQSGHVMVAFGNENKVIKYDMTGAVIHEFDSKRTKRPRAIAENKVTKDIYICNEKDDFHNSVGKVLAIDMKNECRFIYRGPHPGSFTPKDVCADSHGNVLITDHVNNKVHILGKNGDFLQYLLTSGQGLKNPWYIDVDEENNAWIGEYGGHVKIVKYLST